MTREIPVYIDATHVDEDTRVGYGFQSKLFFVDNKGTRTTRADSQDILDVLKVVTNNNPRTLGDNSQLVPITKEMLDDLASTPEKVTSIFFTYEDTGAFIKTIAFNDYDYYPLVIDCPLHKLYIMNTDKVYDLTLNVAPSFIEDDLISFYTLTLGLDMPRSLMAKVISRLKEWYVPKVYNHIAPRKESRDTVNPLYYSNQVSLSNYDGTSKATYTCTINPNGDVVYTKMGDIVGLDIDTKTISLINTSSSFASFPTTEDHKVYIQGLSEGSGSDTYSADGAYTWVSTNSEDHTITVQNPFPFNFSFPYPKVYLESPRTTITSVDNTTASIVVTSATNFNIGDTLTIIGSTKGVNDGNYNIIGINGTTLTLDSIPPVSVVADYGIATVLTYVGEVASISSQVITLRENPLVSVSANYYLVVGDEKDKCVLSVSGKSITIKPAWEISDYTPVYPTLSYNSQATTVSINVTSSTTEKLPEGEFFVDDNAQCINYLKLGGVERDSEALTNVNTEVPIEASPISYIEDEDEGWLTVPVYLKGLYSEIYS